MGLDLVWIWIWIRRWFSFGKRFCRVRYLILILILIFFYIDRVIDIDLDLDIDLVLDLDIVLDILSFLTLKALPRQWVALDTVNLQFLRSSRLTSVTPFFFMSLLMVSMYRNVGLPLGLTPSTTMFSTVLVVWLSYLRLICPYQRSRFCIRCVDIDLDIDLYIDIVFYIDIYIYIDVHIDFDRDPDIDIYIFLDIDLDLNLNIDINIDLDLNLDIDLDIDRDIDIYVDEYLLTVNKVFVLRYICFSRVPFCHLLVLFLMS